MHEAPIITNSSIQSHSFEMSEQCLYKQVYITPQHWAEYTLRYYHSIVSLSNLMPTCFRSYSHLTYK